MVVETAAVAGVGEGLEEVVRWRLTLIGAHCMTVLRYHTELHSHT